MDGAGGTSVLTVKCNREGSCRGSETMDVKR